jgi:sodium pump decarboxylase gamma subunit
LIDWGEAIRIAGGGFGMVFLVLVILALVVWIVGLVSQRRAAAKSEPKSNAKKGAK